MPLGDAFLDSITDAQLFTVVLCLLSDTFYLISRIGTLFASLHAIIHVDWRAILEHGKCESSPRHVPITTDAMFASCLQFGCHLQADGAQLITSKPNSIERRKPPIIELLQHPQTRRRTIYRLEQMQHAESINFRAYERRTAISTPRKELRSLIDP